MGAKGLLDGRGSSENVLTIENLSGRHGSNRFLGHRQISADTDRDAVLAWLERYKDNSHTFASNRKEAERLLLWSLKEARKPLSSLTYEDLSLYRRFLAHPHPTDRWVMLQGRKWPRHDPRWRPFVGPLSETSIRQSLVILNSMFAWLVQVRYLIGNPLSFLRKRQARPPARVIRFLDEELWGHVKTTIHSMPVTTTREQLHQTRARWLFSLLFLCGLRISEVVHQRMGQFFCRREREGRLQWWLDVIGKGNKPRLVPATHELMEELRRYRESVGLPPLPLEHETTPLLLPLTWRISQQEIPEMPEPLTRSTAHTIIKGIFEATAQRLEAQGDDYWAQAQRVRSASAHWLRHTAGSRLANTVDLRHVRDTLGHTSLNTTSLYLHGEDDQRHRAIEKGHRLDWERGL